MVFFSKQQACVLKSVAVKIVGVLEDLAYCVHCNVLSEDVLALLLDGLNVVPVSKL